MDNKTIQKYILPFEKRKQLSKELVFKQMFVIWNEERLQTDQKQGSIPYLLKKAHEECEKKHPEKPIMSRLEWGMFYNQSGQERLKRVEKEKDSYSLNLYHGRTVLDFVETAKQFSQILKERGINISSSICLNFIYIVIVDYSYIEYVRQIKAIHNFCLKNSNTKYKLTDPLTCLNNGVDATIFSSDDKLLFAVQVVPESYLKDTSRNKKIKLLNKQKHDSFEYIYRIKVKTIYASTSGFIKHISD